MSQIDQSDAFRSRSEVHAPDPRNEAIAVFDDECGELRPKTFDDHHAGVATIQLVEAVPADIRIQFDTARNILLYSWHVYRFIPIAELAALACVELALKQRFGGATERPGLKRLLDRAISQGLVRDAGFRVYQRGQTVRQLARLIEPSNTEGRPADLLEYSRVLVDSLPERRNDLAHGSTNLLPGGFITLEICCDLINQLFSGAPDVAA